MGNAAVQLPQTLWQPWLLPANLLERPGCFWQLLEHPGASLEHPRVQEQEQIPQGCDGEGPWGLRCPWAGRGGASGEPPPPSPHSCCSLRGSWNCSAWKNPLRSPLKPHPWGLGTLPGLGTPSFSRQGRKRWKSSQIRPCLCNCPGAAMAFSIQAKLSWEAA